MTLVMLWRSKTCLDTAVAYPAREYHDDYGPVLWWKLPINEPPYVGTPLDDGWIEDYYTHWSPIQIPIEPGRLNPAEAFHEVNTGKRLRHERKPRVPRRSEKPSVASPVRNVDRPAKEKVRTGETPRRLGKGRVWKSEDAAHAKRPRVTPSGTTRHQRRKKVP